MVQGQPQQQQRRIVLKKGENVTNLTEKALVSICNG